MIRTARAGSHLGRRKTTCSAPPNLFRTPQLSAFVSPVARRYNHNTTKETAQATAQVAADTPESIPGPNWLWLEPIYEPFRAYGRVQQRRPYMTQFVSSLVIYFVGDMVAQSISTPDKAAVSELRGNEEGVVVAAGEHGQSQTAEDEGEDARGWVQAWMEDRDWARTARALFIGGAAAVPGYRWFLWLSNSFNYSSKILSLTTKVAINQLTFTPLFNTYFFGTQSLLSGASLPEALERIKNTVPTSWINSCKFWPGITAFMFMYIPLQYRSIFGGVIAIGWQTYLSLLNQRAAREEGKLHLHGEGQGQGDRQCVKKPDQGKDDAVQTREKCAA